MKDVLHTYLQKSLLRVQLTSTMLSVKNSSNLYTQILAIKNLHRIVYKNFKPKKYPALKNCCN